ncbi:TetR/AcrR family transcriptional regulator [Liquorilactobacillus sicerae]|uniref:TetR/AcrR family transcriptional regulator n=1 Tax=Liquorilactobacillus sicerae TaxID=1416943 RepID=UPI0024805DDC|nr:TetR/AcrR family transcriptional regulator [Liquorilactobacillus sicerae]
MKKEDLRIFKTKRLIFRAFVDLIFEKDFASITVQDIADRAMINRSTFYSHFRDKQDVLEQVFPYVLLPLLGSIENNIIESGNVIREKKIVEIVTKIFLQVKSEKKFYLLVLRGRNMILMDTFKKFLREHFSEIFSKLQVKNGDQIIPNDFIISYLVTTFMSTIYWWLENDCSLSAENMARIMIKLISSAGLAIGSFRIEHD